MGSDWPEATIPPRKSLAALQHACGEVTAALPAVAAESRYPGIGHEFLAKIRAIGETPTKQMSLSGKL